ncbi:hypothetical protein N1851_015776 [Merluccius polli]|uniref:Uncharacterized protein n=1 Tax=Merluccius polli TaxID=89951 RepID=A0AA47MRJ0_MERPO|nr:hypothetical protein N1851_015776 [Merluccius polli]
MTETWGRLASVEAEVYACTSTNSGHPGHVTEKRRVCDQNIELLVEALQVPAFQNQQVQEQLFPFSCHLAELCTEAAVSFRHGEPGPPKLHRLWRVARDARDRFRREPRRMGCLAKWHLWNGG